MESAVRYDIPGIRDLCRELRDGDEPLLRFHGAAGLYHVGDRDPATLQVIQDWLEANRKSNKIFAGTSLLRSPMRALPFRDLESRLCDDTGFWAWWDEVRESFNPHSRR